MSLVVHEFGSPESPELVLLHGLTEAGTAWPDAVDRWAADWRIIAPDLRGHGDSPRFTGSQLEAVLEVLTGDVIELLESVCRGPAVLLGHSLGGRLAVLVATERPDLVAGLVLEDPALASVSRAGAAFVAEQEAFLDAFADGGAAEVARMRQVTSWSDAEIQAWAACKPQVDRTMLAHLHLGEWDVVSVLNALVVPTLLVVPADGETARHRGAVTNPLVEAALLPGVGHCVRRDDPAAFHAVVDPFLARLARPSHPRPRRTPRVPDRPNARRDLPFLRSGPLSHVHVDAWPLLDAHLERWGYLRFELDGRRMTSRQEAHRHIGEVFGFPDWYGAGWDAFNDCIGQFVVDHDGQRVAVIWHHLEEMAEHAPATLAEVGWGLLETQIGDMPARNPANRTGIELVVFAVGDGPDFDRPE